MKVLTWEELANMYDAAHCGPKARTLPMDRVFEWVKRHPGYFVVGRDGIVYLRQYPTLAPTRRD